ncbi:MAG: GNAT family N-acetyltransferase [Oscillospiraceae bacterium]|nr:GNAT family N-acetyltransferase [Oscillospiraceae bacterium]
MVSVVEVKSKRQIREFVDYPNRLYRDVPQFVPATYDDDLQDWDRKKNTAFAYCQARCWLAYREGEIVGRIGAILSRRANEKWGTNRMRFTQVDFIDDREVSRALFETVESWAREMGCDEVHGPLGFTDLDREGMLVEGFDRRSCFFTYYNHPYYIEHLTALGYGKDVDWVENYITVPYDEKTLERWQRLSDFVLRRYHLHLFNARTRLDYLPLLGRFFKLVNTAYAPLYGTVELSDEQIRRYAGKFAPLLNPKLTCFVMDENDEMVAMGVGAPSIAAALQRSRGRYLPFGWLGLLKAFVKNDTIDLLLIAVDPKYQGKGVNAAVINKVMRGAVAMGITHAETGPMLETNEKVQDQWKDVPLERHKRRRCFLKKLEK